MRIIICINYSFPQYLFFYYYSGNTNHAVHFFIYILQNGDITWGLQCRAAVGKQSKNKKERKEKKWERDRDIQRRTSRKLGRHCLITSNYSLCKKVKFPDPSSLQDLRKITSAEHGRRMKSWTVRTMKMQENPIPSRYYEPSNEKVNGDVMESNSMKINNEQNDEELSAGGYSCIFIVDSLRSASYLF